MGRVIIKNHAISLLCERQQKKGDYTQKDKVGNGKREGNANLNLVVDVSVAGRIITDQNCCQVWWAMAFIFPFDYVLLELLSNLLGDSQTVDYLGHLVNTVALAGERKENEFAAN